MKRYLAFVSLLTIVTGCQSSSLVPSSAYVKADRQTLNAVRPLLEQTKADRPSLTQPIDDALTAWDARVTAAEKVAK